MIFLPARLMRTGAPAIAFCGGDFECQVKPGPNRAHAALQKKSQTLTTDDTDNTDLQGLNNL
jgi:hypothetical protein